MRAFGGQVAAHAQVAAGRTVEADLRIHSLHGYFLRPGRTDASIVYLVERLRDGRSFSTRRVSAVQDGETLFSMSASFTRPRETPDSHHLRAPDVPGPQASKRAWEPIDDAPEFRPFQLIDVRFAAGLDGPPQPATPQDGMPHQHVWMRVAQPLPDDPLLHVCALTYLSDLSLAHTATLPYAKLPGQINLVSLDHAMWFHRPFRADDWLLFVQDSPNAGGGLGLSRGVFFSAAGELVASVTQEAGMLRR